MFYTPFDLHCTRSNFPKTLSFATFLIFNPSSLNSQFPSLPRWCFLYCTLWYVSYLCVLKVQLFLCFSPFQSCQLCSHTLLFFPEHCFLSHLPSCYLCFFFDIFVSSLALFRMDRWGVVPCALWGLGMVLWLDEGLNIRVMEFIETKWHILAWNSTWYSLYFFKF